MGNIPVPLVVLCILLTTSVPVFINLMNMKLT